MYFILIFFTIQYTTTIQYTMIIHYTETVRQLYMAAGVKFILAFSMTLNQDTASLDRT